MGNISWGDFMNYLLFISRFAAFCVDYIIFFVLSYFLSKLGTMGYFILLFVFFIYRYLTTALWGATAGMMILRIKLVNKGFKSCLKREIYRFSSALFYLGYIYALFNKAHQTFHDHVSGTIVVFGKTGDKNISKIKRNKIVFIISTILLVFSSLRWLSYVVLNDIGLIGLERVYVSEEYYQSFEGDNLISLSQDELYMKTLGRKYITLIDVEGKATLARLSNKLKYTEVYKLNIENGKITGEYLYRVNIPIQFVCSGNFRGSTDMCGVSPQHKIILVDQKGSIYGEENIGLGSILTLRCGDMDLDGREEAVVLGRGGDVEVFKLEGKDFRKIFSGKIGEDIVPESFYIDKGLVVVGRGNDKKILYFYDFRNGKFVYRNKKDFKVRSVSSAAKLHDNIIVSHVFRNNMTFRRGNTQLLEVYSIKDGINRLYNLGARPGRGYSYMVRVLEDIVDIDRDGIEEIVLKAVGKDDVMGQGYIVEVYREKKGTLWVNKVLTWLEGVLY